VKTNLFFAILILILLPALATACDESDADAIDYATVTIEMYDNKVLNQMAWVSFGWSFSDEKVGIGSVPTDCVFHPISGSIEHYILGCPGDDLPPIMPLDGKGTVTTTYYYKDENKAPRVLITH